MSAFRCQMLPIPSKSQPQILLKTARRRTWPGSSRWRGAGPVFQGAVRAVGGGLPTLPRRAQGTGGAGPMAGGPGANES